MGEIIPLIDCFVIDPFRSGKEEIVVLCAAAVSRDSEDATFLAVSCKGNAIQPRMRSTFDRDNATFTPATHKSLATKTSTQEVCVL